MSVSVLVGMIASGKSTFAAQKARQGAICLNDDAIVNLLHGGDYTLYDEGLKALYKSVENHVLAVGLALGRDVVVDRGLSISRAARARWVALARALDVPCEVVVFQNEGPAVHAERRFRSDARGHPLSYWQRVAASHQARWEEPTLTEGFDAISWVSAEEIMGASVPVSRRRERGS
jgi:predicted kinase